MFDRCIWTLDDKPLFIFVFEYKRTQDYSGETWKIISVKDDFMSEMEQLKLSGLEIKISSVFSRLTPNNRNKLRLL